MTKAFDRARLLMVVGIVFGNVAAVTPLHAATLTYEFTVTATDGPLAGTVATGAFAFDDSIVPATLPSGGTIVGGTNLLTDVAFTWNNLAYDETTANTGAFIFYPSFSTTGLFNLVFGTDCSSSGCGIGAGDEGWVLSLYDNGSGDFSYSTVNAEGVYSGSATYGAASVVPIPSTLLLFSTGLVGLGMHALSKRTK